MKHTPEKPQYSVIETGDVPCIASGRFNLILARFCKGGRHEAEQFTAAFNHTYGKDINPEGIPAAVEALRILTLERHLFTASQKDADTCHYCGGNFRSEDHFREGDSREKDLGNARQALAALEAKEEGV
jgi:hypothetical protein